MEMAIYHTGGAFSYLPHHLDLALEDSVGHSTCTSVLARRRAIMGLGLGLGLGLVGSWRWGKYGYLPHRCGDSVVPVAAPRQDRSGCTINPMIALRRANTLMHMYCDQPSLQTRDPGGGVNKKIPHTGG